MTHSKGIWLSIELLHDTSLTMQEKLILSEIKQLSELDTKQCYASNEHFAKLLNISKKSASNTISSLVKKDKITVELSSRNHKRLLSTKDGQPSTKDGESKDNKQFNKQLNTSLEEKVVSMWNEFATRNKRSKILKLTGKRKKKLQERIKELKDYETALKITLEKASNSSFCLEGKWFSFDWLIENDTNLVKVFEGKYDNEKVEYK